MTSKELQAEALSRAVGSLSMVNYPVIIQEFMAKGLQPEEIRPRENVFTYHAWRALGRQVRKGEHGVKVVTWIECEKMEPDEKTGQEKPKYFKRPWGATVFHISQTDAIN